MESTIVGVLGVLLFSSFVKIFLVLSILRIGLGLTGIGMSIVTGLLSVALCLVIHQGQVTAAGGLEKLMSAGRLEDVATHFKGFTTAHADSAVLDRFNKLQGQSVAATGNQTSNPNLLASFLITEIREACEIGVSLLIPFLLVDIAIAVVLSLLSVTQLSASVVGIPLKLAIFLAANGWTLITEKVLSSYS